MMNDITVVLLAGGDSSRMWPIREKNFLKFLGVSLISHTVSTLRRFGLNNIILVSHKNNKANFEREVGKSVQEVIVQHDERGMAGALLSVKQRVAGKKLLVVCPTDIFEDSLYRGFSRILESDPVGVIAGVKVKKYFPGGYLTLSGETVTGIMEKPQPDNCPSDVVNAVFHYFRDANPFIAALEHTTGDAEDHYERALQTVLSSHPFALLRYDGFWGHLKYPWHVLMLSNHFLKGIKTRKAPSAKIDQTVKLIGDVIIGEHVRIMEYAKIVGPTYIGSGSTIGNHCMVRESIIGENCVVGFGSEITRSYIGDDCWFHANFIGDSVIDAGVTWGAGALTANFRLDELEINSMVFQKRISTHLIKHGAIVGKHASIGVRSSLMPGVKIGGNSVIGPGVLLRDDVPDNTFVSVKQEHTVRKNRNQEAGDYREAERKKLA